MTKKIILILVIMILTLTLTSQEIKNDIIEVNYKQKSVAKAMILSSLFPGAGQFYADKKSITTYLSPLIEIGLLAGFFVYNEKGDDITDDYEKFANSELVENPINGEMVHRYSRDRHDEIKNDFLGETYFYDADHFQLDDTDTQHFYEDIGKYNKYIFGWLDWYEIYGNGDVDWIWDTSNTGNDNNSWEGNIPVNEDYPDYEANHEFYDNTNGKYSSMRATYINMRKDAEKYYDKAKMFNFGIIFNHILAAIDAARLTKKYNLEYLSSTTSQIKVKFAPVMINNEISPGVFLTKRF